MWPGGNRHRDTLLTPRETVETKKMPRKLMQLKTSSVKKLHKLNIVGSFPRTRPYTSMSVAIRPSKPELLPEHFLTDDGHRRTVFEVSR